MYKDLKVAFMGTPSFGAKALEYLIENTTVVMVVCQPDAYVGRKKVLTAPIIKQIALDNGIDVFQPVNIKENYQELKDSKPDLIITAAYGQIVPQEVLDIPRLGCINLHGSLLPKYRGAAPIQWSIINGDDVTGVTLMYMEKSMDTGNMIDKIEVVIDSDDNYHTLYDKLSCVSVTLLSNNLEDIKNGTNKSVVQDHDSATIARMIKREDECVDMNDLSINIFNKVRGIYPNAYINFCGSPLKVLKCSYELCDIDACNVIKNINKNILGITSSDGVVYLEVVKPLGKKEMDIKSFINGLNIKEYEGINICK